MMMEILLSLDSEVQDAVIHRTVQNYIHDASTILEDERYKKESKTIQAFAGNS